jgi:hypothetical protein
MVFYFVFLFGFYILCLIFITFNSGYNGESENEACRIDSIVKGSRDLVQLISKAITTPGAKGFYLTPLSLYPLPTFCSTEGNFRSGYP